MRIMRNRWVLRGCLAIFVIAFGLIDHTKSYAYELYTLMPRAHLLQKQTDNITVGSAEYEGKGVGISFLFPPFKKEENNRYISLSADYFSINSDLRYDISWDDNSAVTGKKEMKRFRGKLTYLVEHPIKKLRWLNAGYGLFYNIIEYPAVAVINPSQYEPYIFQSFEVVKYHEIGFDSNITIQFNSKFGFFINSTVNMGLTLFGDTSAPDGFESDSGASGFSLDASFSANAGYERDFISWTGGIMVGYLFTNKGSPDRFNKYENGMEYQLKVYDMPLSSIFFQAFVRF